MSVQEMTSLNYTHTRATLGTYAVIMVQAQHANHVHVGTVQHALAAYPHKLYLAVLADRNDSVSSEEAFISLIGYSVVLYTS